MGKKSRNAGSKKKSQPKYPNSNQTENLKFLIENPNFSMIDYMKTEFNYTDEDIMNDLINGYEKFKKKYKDKSVEDIINESEDPTLMREFMNMPIYEKKI